MKTAGWTVGLAAAFFSGLAIAQTGSSQVIGSGGIAIGNGPPVSPAGAGGVAGGGSAQLFAVIREDGTIARDKGAIDSIGDGSGFYLVYFARNITNCVYTATIGLPDAPGIPDPGVVTVSRAAAGANVVYVVTRGMDGYNDPRPFHLWVNC